jgi:hypothetical protein
MVANVPESLDLSPMGHASAADRLLSAAIAAAAFGLLLVARGLSPDPSGLGTHTQLGLPVCAWYSQTGRPCITCGVTTAFVLVAQGRLPQALATQPFGAILGLAAGAMVLLGGYAAWHGLSLVRLLAPLCRPTVFVGGAALVLLSWGYKMAVCP